MGVVKQHYKLDEAAGRLGQNWSLEDLLYLGAFEDLPIYVETADWLVEFNIRDASQPTEWPTGIPPIDSTSPPVALCRDRLSGLVRLHRKTLMRFHADLTTTTNSFLVERQQDGEEHAAIYEYRLVPESGLNQWEIPAIGCKNLVVVADDIVELHKTGIAALDKPMSTKERHSLLKLVVGMAIKGYAYHPKAKRSEVIPEICKDLDLLGIPISDDTVRKFLNEGCQLLPDRDEEV